ncbi:MAG: T9SS type A sorting domain-containing protein, partial [Bacteroidetes bacterium]|nr:T9SS type A sorting domain-containing protein [Bacteroidota bacterium]
GSEWEIGNSVIETPNGDVIVVGQTKSYGVGEYDIYIIRVDAQGDTIWTKAIGGNDWDMASDIIAVSSGGFLIAGETKSYGQGDKDGYLLRINDDGKVRWAKTYGGSDRDAFHSVLEDDDGNFITAGYTFSYGAGDLDFYLVKTDSSGTVLWSKTYGGVLQDWGQEVRQTLDKGFIIAGYTTSFGMGLTDNYLVRVDSAGDTVWTRAYGSIHQEFANGLTITSDGGFVIVGAEDYLTIKVDANGDTVWTSTYTSGINGIAAVVTETPDGGLVIGGKTRDTGIGLADILLVKTDGSGSTGCNRFPTQSVMSKTASFVGTGVMVDSGFIEMSTPTMVFNPEMGKCNGCVDEPVIIIDSVQDASCSGISDGSIDISITSSASYTVLWTNNLTDEDITGLPAGSYRITVSDSTGCKHTQTIEITEPDSLTISGIVEDVDPLLNNGSIDISVNGGTLPYTYLWSEGSTTEDISSLSAGTYSVVVTDSAGCMDSISFTVGVVGLSARAEQQIKLYPMPVDDQLYLDLGSSYHIELEVQDITGRMWISKEVHGSLYKLDMKNLPDGFYILRLRTKVGYIHKKVLKL